jgi:hypothetical protein
MNNFYLAAAHTRVKNQIAKNEEEEENRLHLNGKSITNIFSRFLMPHDRHYTWRVLIFKTEM